MSRDDFGLTPSQISLLSMDQRASLIIQAIGNNEFLKRRVDEIVSWTGVEPYVVKIQINDIDYTIEMRKSGVSLAHLTVTSHNFRHSHFERIMGITAKSLHTTCVDLLFNPALSPTIKLTVGPIDLTKWTASTVFTLVVGCLSVMSLDDRTRK